jgi:Copine
MTMAEFCNNNKYLPLRISVFSYTNSGDHPKYGSVICNLKDIEMLGKSEMPIRNTRGKKTGSIRFETLKMDMRPSLVEYLRQGWKIDVNVCVDFSLSNLEINDYRSLHKVNSNGDMNVYEKALFEVCNVMMPYARNG